MHYELIEELTKQFYEWEQRGRGWDLWSFPVDPEPPFIPFYYHSAEKVVQIDDGRKPTLLSSFADTVKRVLFPTESQDTLKNQTAEYPKEISPQPFTRSDEIQEIKIVLPPEYKMDTDYLEQCILGITLQTSLISFEVIGMCESIIIQFACISTDTTPEF